MRSIKEVMQGNLLIFTLGDAMRQLSMFITFPFFSLYVVELGGNVVEIGIVTALRPLLSLFIYPIAGYLSDHYNRAKIIASTCFFTTIIWLLFIFANHWRMLAIGNLLFGFWAFYFPAANALMADSLPPNKRATGYSLWIAIPGAIGIISPFIGGYLTTVLGVAPAMRLLYSLTFVFSFLIAVMNLKFLKESAKYERTQNRERLHNVLLNSYRNMTEILKRLPRDLKAFAVMLVMSFFFNSMTSSYWVIFNIEQIGLNKLQWGIILLIAAIVNVVFLLPAGVLVDRLSVKRVLTLALGTSSIPILLFPFSRGFWDVVILFVAITIANSFLISGAPAFMAQSISTERRGRVMAALGQGALYINTRGGGSGGPGMGTILTIPSILGSLVGGFIYSFNPKLHWILLGGSMVVSSAISAIFISNQK